MKPTTVPETLLATAYTPRSEPLNVRVVFQWVGPLYEEDWVILAPQDSEVTINSLEDLKQFQVGSYEYDAITDHLMENKIGVVPAKSDAVNVVKLKLGKIELWASSSLTGPYTASNFNMPVKPIHTFSESSLWLAMHKDTDPTVVSQLNNELKKDAPVR